MGQFAFDTKSQTNSRRRYLSGGINTTPTQGNTIIIPEAGNNTPQNQISAILYIRCCTLSATTTTFSSHSHSHTTKLNPLSPFFLLFTTNPPFSTLFRLQPFLHGSHNSPMQQQTLTLRQKERALLNFHSLPLLPFSPPPTTLRPSKSLPVFSSPAPSPSSSSAPSAAGLNVSNNQ